MDESKRPWGEYKILTRGEGYQIKEIVVLPGKRLSYQSHQRRAEHWLIIEGKAEVTIDGNLFPLSLNQNIDIQIGQKHRIANTGNSNLRFIEIQTGDYFGEDDIIRFEDDFGRN